MPAEPPVPPAVDALIAELRSQGDHQALFYALLLRKRVELGVSPFPTGPASDLPPEAHADYEDAIRAAAHEVGGTLLAKGDIPAAWPYYRMLNEPEPVKQALRDFRPGDGVDVYPLVEIAWQQALLPERGFDLVLDSSGICSAVTMVQSADLRERPAVRDHCVSRLVEALVAQLRDRLTADAEHRGLAVPAGVSAAELVDRYPQLAADENYHVDVSHLSSVVQLAMQLPPGRAADSALELCDYGRRLSPALRGDPGVPFEATYDDYRPFLLASTGRDIDAGLDHFRAKLAATADDPDDARFVAEVLVALLDRVGRVAEALGVARKYLADAPAAHLSCAGVEDLAKRAGDFAGLAADAEAKGDPVTALAARIAGQLPLATSG